jgi:hypothetical protein
MPAQSTTNTRRTTRAKNTAGEMLHPASKAHPASDDKAKALKRKRRTKAEIAADRKAEEEAKAAQVMKKQAQIKQLAKLEEKLDEDDTNELTPRPNPSRLTYSGDRVVAGDDALPQLDVGTKQKVPGQCQETDSDIDGGNHVNIKIVGGEAIESGSEVQSLPDELDSEARDTTAEKEAFTNFGSEMTECNSEEIQYPPNKKKKESVRGAIQAIRNESFSGIKRGEFERAQGSEGIDKGLAGRDRSDAKSTESKFGIIFLLDTLIIDTTHFFF